MKIYNPDQPLIFIHIPKTAGVSVTEVFRKWYNSRLLLHYYDEYAEKMPVKYNLELTHDKQLPTCIYGHFNRKRGFGLEDYYPCVNQFITILRDPFERAISGYFFQKKYSTNWREKDDLLKEPINNFLKNRQSGILNFLPKELNENNFKEIIEEKFVHIGVTEYLEDSLIDISGKINQTYPTNLIQHLNVTDRTQKISYELRQIYMENNKLEYAIYNYVLDVKSREIINLIFK